MPEIVIPIAVIGVCLLFDFANGWNDSANAIATVVSTRVLSPVKAVMLAAVLNFVGALLSTRVAKTIGSSIVDTGVVNPVDLPAVIMAAMLAAFLWVALCTLFGLPISGSHSLIGGLVGAAMAFFGGTGILHLAGLKKIFLALVISPVLGIFVGFALMLSIIWLCRHRTPSGVNKVFGKLQILSASLMALSHGSNDAQKVMGVITLTLFGAGWQQDTDVQLWVILLCATVMGLGTYIGGWRVIKTLGHGLIKLQPVHGFAAETTASIVIAGASAIGLPVSTTHCITGSIMGVGSTRGVRAVRWGLGKKIAYAWLFTLPGCALVAASLYYLLSPLI